MFTTTKFATTNPSRFAVAVPVTIALALTLSLSTTVQAGEPGSTRLLSVQFEPRPVDKVEVGDFHFIPGQPAPVHTHAAPVFGYVSKGAIYYQVAGQKPQLLKTGDAFYEPVGPDILHFDNASKTKEAVFTDFNLQRKGEPFIVFPTPPTAKIDRRTFPTVTLDGSTVNRVDIAAQLLKPGGKLATDNGKNTRLFYVAEGEVRLQLEGEAPATYTKGQTFATPKAKTVTGLVNTSATGRAKLIRFVLLDTK